MRCANPGCHRESSYLRDGSLYCIDDVQAPAGEQQRRFIWLCSTCAPSFRVETWRPPGEHLRSSEIREAIASEPERPLRPGDSRPPQSTPKQKRVHNPSGAERIA
jgi:hypothetical protein